MQLLLAYDEATELDVKLIIPQAPYKPVMIEHRGMRYRLCSMTRLAQMSVVAFQRLVQQTLEKETSNV
jgi:hypothetical protein